MCNVMLDDGGKTEKKSTQDRLNGIMNQCPHRHRHSLGCTAGLVAKPVDALSFTIKHAKHDIDARPCTHSAAFPRGVHRGEQGQFVLLDPFCSALILRSPYKF
jgi:hypothetical protein